MLLICFLFFLREEKSISIGFLILSIIYGALVLFIRGKWTKEICVDLEKNELLITPIAPWESVKHIDYKAYAEICTSPGNPRYPSTKLQLRRNGESITIAVIEDAVKDKGFLSIPKEVDFENLAELRDKLAIDLSLSNIGHSLY